MTDPISPRLQIWKEEGDPSQGSRDINPASLPAPPARVEPTPEEQLAILREILLREQSQRLDGMESTQREMEVTSGKLADMLPQAVQDSTQTGDRLAEALSPTLTKSFQELVKSDPQALVDVISPILFPTIRAAIRDAIKAMVQTLNQALESSMSWQSLAWRWESWRTGRPFAEVVLLHSLLYRVEQVLLVHRQTGVLLQHVSNSNDGKDADVISGMLTALQDFARDSFGVAEEEPLRELQVGDTTVYAAQGNATLLCAVIQGNPSPEVREKLRETSDAIHSRFARELRAYRGDNNDFVSCRPLLESCLLSAYEARKASPVAKYFARMATAIIFLSVCGLLAWGMYRGWELRQAQHVKTALQLLRPPSDILIKNQGQVLRAEGEAPRAWLEFAATQAQYLPQGLKLDLTRVKDRDQAWYVYLEQLRATPGIAITRAEILNEEYVVEGFRDAHVSEDSISPQRSGLNPELVTQHWRLFEAQEPEFKRMRLVEMLALPPEVLAEFAGEILHLRGSASHDWLESAKGKVSALGLTDQVDFTQVHDLELDRLRKLCGQIENIDIPFEEDGLTISTESFPTLQVAATQAEAAFQQAQDLSEPIRLIVVGDGKTKVIAKQRARRAAEELLKLGVRRDMVVIATRDSLARESQKPPVNGCRLDVQVGLFDW